MKKISTFALIATLFSTGTFAASIARLTIEMSPLFISLCLIELKSHHLI